MRPGVRGFLVVIAVVLWPVVLLAGATALSCYVTVLVVLSVANYMRATRGCWRTMLRLGVVIPSEIVFYLTHLVLFGSILWYYVTQAGRDNVRKGIPFAARQPQCAADISELEEKGVTADSPTTPLSHNSSDATVAHVTDWLKVDVYHAAPPGEGHTSGARPVILFVYGGAWSSGQRWYYAKLAATLRDVCHAVVVVMDYAHYPHGTMASMVRDVHNCLRWINRAIHSFGGDPSAVTLVGHSAGAHLVALHQLRLAMSLAGVATPGSVHDRTVNAPADPARRLGCRPPVPFLDPGLGWRRMAPVDTLPPALTSPDSLADLGEQALPVVTDVVLLAGVYDLVAHRSYEAQRGVVDLSAMTGATSGHWDSFAPTQLADALAASPNSERVSRLLPRMHVIHGEQDTTVPPSQSRDFHASLARLHGSTGRSAVPLELFPRLGHFDIVFGPVVAQRPIHPTVAAVAAAVHGDRSSTQ